MAAARHLVTVQSLKPDNPLSWKLVYTRSSFVHYKCKYSPRALSRAECLDNWLITQSLRPLVTQTLGSSDDRYNSGVEEDESVPRISYQQFLTQLKIWANNQSLPVAVAGYALYCGFTGFLFGYLWTCVVQFFLPFSKDPQAQAIRAFGVPDGDYNLLALSIFVTPLMGARFYAIMSASTTSISYVIKRLGVKMSFTPRELTAGFGCGVIFSLVNGFRRPATIFLAGVFFALIYGLGVIPIKFSEGKPDPFHLEIGENADAPDGYMRIMVNYLFSRIYYLVRRFGKIF